MSTPEGKVKDFISSKMKRWFPDAFKYCPPGGPFGKAGMPDFMYFIGTPETHVTVGIEAKAVDGFVSDIQKSTLTRLARCGVLVAVVRGKDLKKMEMIRDAVLHRLQVADAKPGPPTVQAPGNYD
jgi:hypothetical protein